MLRLPKPPKFSPEEGLRTLKKYLQKAEGAVESIAREIDAIAGETGESPQTTATPEVIKPVDKQSSEECPVCSELADLKEYVGKQKVKKALLHIKQCDSESAETLRKYIEGEDVA